VTARRRGSHRPRTFVRRRPVLAWIVVIAAVLVGAALLTGRMLRAPLHVRAPSPGAAPQTVVQVYFVGTARGRPLTLAPVRRRVPIAPEETLAASAVRVLLEGPTRRERSHGLVTEIPPGTVLRGVTIRDGIATVDLGVSFAEGGGSSSMLARVWQVVYTTTQFPKVSSVQLLIGGRRVDTLGGEGLMIGAPFSRPASMPTF
jgi:spore germination protein GerM